MKNAWLNDKVFAGMGEQSVILESLLSSKTELVDHVRVVNFAVMKTLWWEMTGPQPDTTWEDIANLAQDLICAPSNVDLFSLLIFRILERV